MQIPPAVLPEWAHSDLKETCKCLFSLLFLRYLLTSKWIINLGHFDITFFPKDSTYTYSFSTSFSSLRRIKFESTIQRSTQLTHGVLYLFFNCKKIEFRLFSFCFEKYELFETRWNWTEFNDYPPVSIIAEARKSSGRRYDVFTHGNLGGGLKSMRVALFFASKQPARPWIRLRFSELLGQQTSNGLILIGQITRLNVRPTPELRSVSCNEVDDHLTPFARDSNLSFDSRLSIVFRLV